MNICANHCSYLINFNYVIGLKENIDVVSRHFHQYALRLEVFKCRQVLMEKKPFLSYKSNDHSWARNGTVVLTKVVTFWLTAIFVLRHPRIQCFIACFAVLKYEIEVGKNWTNNETCFPIFWHEWSISPELWLIEAATVTGSGFNQSRIYSRMAISVHVLKPGRRSIL